MAFVDASPRDPAPWRVRRTGLTIFVSPTMLRVRREWRLLSPLAIALLLAATLLCVIPLYSGLLFQTQLQHELAIADPTQINIDINAIRDRSDSSNIAESLPKSVQNIDHQLAGLESRYLASFAPSSVSFFEGANYGAYALVNGASLILNHPALSGAFAQTYAYDYASAAPHMRLFAGRLPRDESADELPEVLVTPKSGLVPGDVVTFSVSAFPPSLVAAQVVGIWYPRDEHDPYWNGQSFDSMDNSLLTKSRITFPLLFTKNALLDVLTQYDEVGSISVHRLYFVHPTALNGQNALDVAEQIARLRALLPLQLLESQGVHNAQIATHLDGLIRELAMQSSLLSLPLYIIVVEIAGLALLFTALAVNVMVEARGSTIAVLVSRGASKIQLLNAFVGPGALLAVLAALVSPLLAAAFTLGVFRLAVPDVSPLDITRLFDVASPTVIGAAILASLLLNIGVLSLAALQATGFNILTFRREQSRASFAPFWKRYYLDVALLLLGVLGYIEMSRLSSLPVRALLGGEQQLGQGPVSTLLLATPALLLPAGALLLVRLFPLVTRLGARLAAHGRGAAGVIGLAHMGEATMQFGRLSLLLTFAVSLGFFALVFQSTLSQNAADRAAYAAGGDIRLPLLHQGQSPQFVRALPDQFAAISGVTAVTSVYRAEAKAVDAQGTASVGVLGIDPDTFAQATYWRQDYGQQSLPVLMGQMRAHRGNVHVGEEGVPLWALISASFAASEGLAVGDRFALDLSGLGRAPYSLVVGGIVTHAPTMYEDAEAGYIVVDQADYVTALENPRLANALIVAPNEYWLRTMGTAGDRAVQTKVQSTLSLYFGTLTLRRQLEAQFQADPLTAGMAGLLLVGTVAAALLALLGGLLQTATAVRQRRTQFAVLRALGMQRRQITSLLLSQQGFLYLFGMVGGSLLGLLVTIALLPYLQFSAVRVDATTLGIPPYTLTLDASHLGLLYLSLLAAMLLSLAVSAALVSRTQLVSALRMGED